MSDPVFCKDCYFSEYREGSLELRCFNPKVNAADEWALASDKGRAGGSSCRAERELTSWPWVPCGKKGKQWVSRTIYPTTFFAKWVMPKDAA